MNECQPLADGGASSASLAGMDEGEEEEAAPVPAYAIANIGADGAAAPHIKPIRFPNPGPLEVGPGRCCPPRHPTHFEPSLLASHLIL